mgnify:CR=1 FL=1
MATVYSIQKTKWEQDTPTTKIKPNEMAVAVALLTASMKLLPLLQARLSRCLISLTVLASCRVS